MSRSYKHQPFIAMCGNSSAKKDKQLAHRGERRGQDHAIRMAWKADDFENFLIPHKFECRWNNTYSWVRDGHQQYCALDKRARHKHFIANQTEVIDSAMWYYQGDPDYTCWPPMWYVEMMRK
jgi:hypothetical protein